MMPDRILPKMAPNCPPTVISSHILVHYSQKVDLKLKIVESEARSNIAQNGFKCSLVVISSLILGQFQSKRWPMSKNEAGYKRHPKWFQMSSNGHIKPYFGPFQPKITISEGRSNIAQNGFKFPQTVIASPISVHYSQKVYTKSKIVQYC